MKKKRHTSIRVTIDRRVLEQLQRDAAAFREVRKVVGGLAFLFGRFLEGREASARERAQARAQLVRVLQARRLQLLQRVDVVPVTSWEDLQLTLAAWRRN